MQSRTLDVPEAKHAIRAGDQALMSLNLLVVDDSSVMRRMVIRSLAVSGLQVGGLFQAENGAEALTLMRSAWVDIVLSDIHMPEMTGIELVERMAADPLLSRIPVVIVSTERGDERLGHLRQLGIKGYLSKPFQPEHLGQLVREVLGLETQ
jgi:two-component system chemotaxis response regulator CheY